MSAASMKFSEEFRFLVSSCHYNNTYEWEISLNLLMNYLSKQMMNRNETVENGDEVAYIRILPIESHSLRFASL
uniref:Uncharacterized protein n=1 Tax=Parascaris univalens TaxID=6257 RepID=A0A915BZ81_PARUN